MKEGMKRIMVMDAVETAIAVESIATRRRLGIFRVKIQDLRESVLLDLVGARSESLFSGG